MQSARTITLAFILWVISLGISFVTINVPWLYITSWHQKWGRHLCFCRKTNSSLVMILWWWFLFLCKNVCKNICCGYSLEVPQWGTLISTHNIHLYSFIWNWENYPKIIITFSLTSTLEPCCFGSPNLKFKRAIVVTHCVWFCRFCEKFYIIYLSIFISASMSSEWIDDVFWTDVRYWFKVCFRTTTHSLIELEVKVNLGFLFIMLKFNVRSF